MPILDKIILNGVTYDIGGSGSGMSDDFKAALDQLVQKVVYIDANGEDYYDALHESLYPPANLSYISAVYTQSGSVYTTDSLNSLKSDLIVTAHYSNGTTATVTSYSLSGTLTVGTSVITVSYGGKATTFNVIVSSAPVDLVATSTWTVGYRLSNGVVQEVTGNEITDYFSVNGHTTIVFEPTGSSPCYGKVAFYTYSNNEYTYVSPQYDSPKLSVGGDESYSVTIPSNVDYARISVTGDVDANTKPIRIAVTMS